MEEFKSLKEALPWLLEDKERLEKEIVRYRSMVEEKKEELIELKKEKEQYEFGHDLIRLELFLHLRSRYSLEKESSLEFDDIFGREANRLFIESNTSSDKVKSYESFINRAEKFLDAYELKYMFLDIDYILISNLIEGVEDIKLIANLRIRSLKYFNLLTVVLNDILATNDYTLILQFLKKNINCFSEENRGDLVTKVITTYNPLYIYLVAINMIGFDEEIKRLVSALSVSNNKMLLDNLLITLFNNKEISNELKSWLANLNISVDASSMFNYDAGFNNKLENAYINGDIETLKSLGISIDKDDMLSLSLKS